VGIAGLPPAALTPPEPAVSGTAAISFDKATREYDAHTEHSETAQNEKVTPAPPSMGVKDPFQLGDYRLRQIAAQTQ
jgi:hypothetical protein